MKTYIALLCLFSAIGHAKQTYTGYSGAPGSKGTCASSCHGSGTGTVGVMGFPTTYEPGKTYTISVLHSGGATISNFNASTRKGTTTAIAGTLVAVSNTAIYSVSGYENGVRASSGNVDVASFTWTAPSAGTGDVTFFLAALQGSKSGPNTKITITSLEQSVTLVDQTSGIPTMYSLGQNYPNPFNPSTQIRYALPSASYVTLTVINTLGEAVRQLVSEEKKAGHHDIQFDASGLSSGIYFYRLQAGSFVDVKKLVLLR